MKFLKYSMLMQLVLLEVAMSVVVFIFLALQLASEYTRIKLLWGFLFLEDCNTAPSSFSLSY